MAIVSIDLSSGDIKEENIILGIDLGTTNSLIANIVNGKPQALSDYGKDVIVPSIIHFDESGFMQVGEEAKEFLVSDPQNTIFSVKRLLGKSYKDIQSNSELIGYKIIDENTDSLVKIQVKNKFYNPIELSSFILKELKKRAEHKLKTTVSQVVITVPAYFNDAQRQATRDAGKLAGLDVLRIINEPTAAALAYGIGINPNQAHTLAVYDFGGGTFDISILRIEGGVFEVLATHGDTNLGGDDLDLAIVHYWLEQNEMKLEQVIEDKSFITALRLNAEKAKKQLSTAPEFVSYFDYQGKNLILTLTLEQFENLIQPIIQKTINSCKNAVQDAEIELSEIENVILVGGSTRVKAVKKAVEDFFKRKPDDSLNPDEVVALGAAVQADILAGNRKDALLLDVTPLSLGVETSGGLMDVIIGRNSKIPTRVAKQYTTGVDGQANMRITVFQGERELVGENRKLGEFVLKGIPSMPAGIPKIEIRFTLDADGILKVTAEELRSGIAQEITIKPQYGLTDVEVEKLLLESVQFAESDIQTRMVLEAKEEAKNILYVTERFLNNNGHLISDEEMNETRNYMQLLMNELGSEDKNKIQEAIENLNEYTRPFAQKVMDVAIQNALSGKNILEK